MSDEPRPAAEPPDGGLQDDLRPLDVDGVGAVTYGTVAWAVGLVLCLLLRDQLAAAGRSWWTWVCVAGTLLGLAGLVFVRRRRAAYLAARAVP